MTSADPDQLISRLADWLRTERRIELGLNDDVGSLSGLEPEAALVEARRLLVQRAGDFQVAAAAVSVMVQRIGQLEQIVRFTEAGWPARRTQLEGVLTAAPSQGLAEWLDDWFTAMTGVRMDAMSRLIELAERLPPGTGVLVDRCRATAVAVEGRQWYVAAPLLQAGGVGLEVGDAATPREEVRLDLNLLLARLALSTSPANTDGARAAIAAARKLGGGRVVDALEARLDGGSSVTGSSGTELEVARTSILERARTATPGPTSLDRDPALSVARSAVGALVSLDDIEAQLAQLLDPVPPELELAVAERAFGDGDPRTALAALGRAVERGGRDAIVGDAYDRLALAESERAEAVSLRLRAANCWEVDRNYDRAAKSYDALLELEPGHLEAMCGLADALYMTSWSMPEEARERLRRAIDLVEQVWSRPDVPASLSWSRLTEAYSRTRLAAFVGEATDDQQWRALLASFRGVALDPDLTRRWVAVADLGNDLDLYALAEVASAAAVRLDGSRETVDEHVRALANLGELRQAMDELRETDDAHEYSMRAHITLCLGDTKTALAILQEHPPDPDELWARWLLIVALTLSGDEAGSVEAAKDLIASLRQREGETKVRNYMARANLVAGHPKRAGTLAEDVIAQDEHEAEFDLAVVEALRGNDDAAVDHFVAYVGNFTSLADVASWEKVELCLAREILRRAGKSLPDLTRVEAALGTVKQALEARRDPDVELLSQDGGKADRVVVETAKALGAIVILVARENTDGVRPALAALSALGGFTDEIASLTAWADGIDAVAGSAAESVDADTTWPPPQAHDGDGATSTETWPLTIELPPSWFEGVDDPVREHPFFLRHLPEQRLVSTFDIPAVHVTTDWDLESDRYRIKVDDTTVEEGRVPLGQRVVRSETLALLAPERGADAVPITVPALLEFGDVSIPDVAGDLSIAALISLSPWEIVCRRLAAVVGSHPPATPSTP
jgi:tetratricopeptide (TPR) repeat protein